MATETKQCVNCKELKPLDEFFNMSKSPDGKHYYCKACCKFRRSVEGVRKRDSASKISSRQQYRAQVEGRERDRDLTLAKLFKRDKGICALCSTAVTPKQASMDHKIPIADGGTHTWDNIQLVHIRCNKVKGRSDKDSLPEGSHLYRERPKSSRPKKKSSKKKSVIW